MESFYNVNDWGIGKQVDCVDGSITLEFFISPAESERPRKTFRLCQVQPILRLDPQTRVFFMDAVAGTWRFGRLNWQAEEDCYISLPNGQTAEVNIADLFVRCNRGVPDACDLLSTRLTETPYFHIARATLVQQLINQRAAAAGLTALLSAPIELEQHQVEVVRRVLSDPVQRYLLADEVGLGKTIEAGVILRQYVLDHPNNHCALVLTPPALVKQWENELKLRLQIGRVFDNRIAVASWDDLTNLPKGYERPGFVIVDEAHQIASGWNCPKHDPRRRTFELLCALTAPEGCPRLLLLSATPVRRNEDSFLALLHLLDPLVYRLEDCKAFRAKVAARQDLADIFYTFTEDQQNLFLEEMTDQLAVRFPNDTRLIHLLTKLKPRLDFSAPTENQERTHCIRAVRSHLHETYRLHRRVLRNRRCEELAGLLPGRSGLSLLFTPCDVASGQLANALENWRSAAASSIWGKEETPEATSLGQVYNLLLEASFCDPYALSMCVQRRLGAVKQVPDRFGPLISSENIALLREVPLFDCEKESLDAILAVMPSVRSSEEQQFAALSKEISRRFNSNTRITLFATSPDRADRVFSYLKILVRGRVFRHSVEDDNWRVFLDTPNGFLVCDHRAEEGLNLHGGRTVLLHLDFPLSPNRMEQRIGRLDRFGVGYSVESFGLMPVGCALLDAWVRCLNGAWQVFDRSIAALQFIVDDNMKAMKLRLLTDGEQAIFDETTKLVGEQGVIAKELKSLRAQDELDAVEIIRGTEPNVTERILEWEDQSADFQRSLESWLVERLQFIRVGVNAMGDNVARYHLRCSNDGKQTLVSRHDFARWFIPSIEVGARHERFSRPLTWPVAYQRQTARHRGVGLARLGNPLVDCLQNYLNWDDRGISFAFWREIAFLEKGSVEVYFRFDFSVEVSIVSLEECLPSRSGVALSALRRMADAAFPPMVLTLWLDENLAVPDELRRKEVLARPYQKPPDTNLNQKRWPLVERHYSLDNWTDLCRAARVNAERMLLQETNLLRHSEDLAVKAEAKFAHVREQMLSRIEALRGSKSEKVQGVEELKFQESVQLSLARAIRKPAINVNSAGVVFLAGMPLEE
jgi:ATP-dependent helicase HepA